MEIFILWTFSLILLVQYQHHTNPYYHLHIQQFHNYTYTFAYPDTDTTAHSPPDKHPPASQLRVSKSGRLPIGKLDSESSAQPMMSMKMPSFKNRDELMNI